MAKEPQTPLVERFDAAGGLHIYRLRMEAFPNFYVYAYLVLGGDAPTLIDTGSGWEKSNADLQAGFEAVAEEYGEKISLADIERVLVTHGHVDHFGGLMFVREHTDAPIGVHPLDRRVLTHYEERVVVASKNLGIFLRRAGLSPGARKSIMEMYQFGKGFYRSAPVDFTLEDRATVADTYQIMHVPGHCPGQVCIRIGDILLTADHVLSRITPHQSPESITRYVGLGHYLDSLEKVRSHADVRIALGGHELPMAALSQRLDEIKASHADRLQRVLELCAEPMTVKQVSQALFGETHGYNILLALEEAGAHVEYLYQRNELVVSNLAELESEDDPVVAYVRV